MIKFLVVYFSVYSAMHAVFYFRIRVLLQDRRILHGFVLLFLFLMIIAPVAIRMLERNGNEVIARCLAGIAFNWTGFIFLSFCGAAIMLIIDTGSWGLNHFSRFDLPLLAGKLPAIILIGTSLTLCLYGYVESRSVKTERIQIKTQKLPEGTGKFKIVQISDVHIGLLTQKNVLEKISTIILAEAPDILVCTGDFVDGMNGHLDEQSSLFKTIEPRYGKYAVTGNHEYYTGLNNALAYIRQLGFTVLQGEVRTVGDVINVVGIDDPAVNRATDENELLASSRNGLFTLLLKHRPLISKESAGLFDLQLSGHTHGGQIYPFNYLVSTQYPFPMGLLKLGQGAWLYTSRGSGTWGPQMRILSPPEVTVIELTGSAKVPDQRLL